MNDIIDFKERKHRIEIRETAKAVTQTLLGYRERFDLDVTSLTAILVTIIIALVNNLEKTRRIEIYNNVIKLLSKERNDAL